MLKLRNDLNWDEINLMLQSKAVCSVISLIAECDYFMESHIDMLLALQEKCTKAKTPPMHFTYLLRLVHFQFFQS